MAPSYDLLMYAFSVFAIAGCWSFLWKDNEIFRIFQFMYIATSAAVGIPMNWNFLYGSLFIPLAQGNLMAWIPTILAVTLFFTFTTKYYWVGRYGTAFIVGISIPLMIRGTIQTTLLMQVAALFQFANLGSSPFDAFSNFIKTLSAVAALAYFFFHYVHRYQVGRATQRIGRYFILFAFGAQFGTRIIRTASFLVYLVGYVLITGPPADYQWFSVPVLIVSVAIIWLAVRWEVRRERVEIAKVTAVS